MAERPQHTRPTPKPTLAALAITKGPLAGLEFDVSDTLVIGRKGDVVIADPEISRRHCIIRIVDGALVVDDLTSLNGTRVNGKRIHSPTLLAPGDVLGLGTTEIEVVPSAG
jgi:pSer/pThr/pTyr-binding forkhead associated (FHA) protein